MQDGEGKTWQLCTHYRQSKQANSYPEKGSFNSLNVERMEMHIPWESKIITSNKNQ